MYKAKEVPTETFVTANEQIMATVMTGQMTTDRNMGLVGIHSPTKYDRSLISSSRIKLIVDGVFYEPYDSEQKTVITSRGYVDRTNIITATWKAGDIEVADYYFIPPGLDVVIHRVQLKNNGKASIKAKLYAILYPHFGGQADYKKGLCEEAHFDNKTNSIITEDKDGHCIFYGFDRPVHEYQVGQVCGNTDVYYDLEDQQLSGCGLQRNAVVNAALGFDLENIPPGHEIILNLGITIADSEAVARERFTRFQTNGDLFGQTRSYWYNWLNQGSAFEDTGEFGRQFTVIDRMSRIMLKTHQSHEGMMIAGSTAGDYQGAIAARNACYSLVALDGLGYHDEVVPGYELLLKFKLGDDRFCSPDENDQLGTILYGFKKHYDFTKDITFLERNYKSLKLFGQILVNLIDPDISLIYSERSIHELSALSRGYETYVNVMAFRGLSDLAQIAGELQIPSDMHYYQKYADILQESIVEKLYCFKKCTFAKRIYQGKLDTTPMISMFTPALFGVLDPNDQKISDTLQYVTSYLWDKQMGGLYRYPLDLQLWDEVPYGGPWVTYTCWLARVFLKRGEYEKAFRCIQWVIDNIPADSITIPEHFSLAHIGRRGFHRTYYYPATPETMATAEFMTAVLEYQKLKNEVDNAKSASVYH